MYKSLSSCGDQRTTAGRLVAHSASSGRKAVWVLWLTIVVALMPPPAPLGDVAAQIVAAHPSPDTDDLGIAERLDSSPAPEPLESYFGRRIAPTMSFLGADWLVRAERQREENCARMLHELRLKPGMVVCDMGCGNGFYALQMARQVGPRGKVLAVDIQPEMLRLLQARADEAGIDNVHSVLGAVADPKLPVDQVDLILCVDVYHEFSHPEHMLRAMRRSLTDDGVLVLLEYREEDPQVPILPLHKMSKKQVLRELQPNGFRLVREFDELPWQHMMFFGRDKPRTDQRRAPAAEK